MRATDFSSPGCATVACCLAVCADDPYCCDTLWDATCATQAGDVDGDGTVGVLDLLLLLALWGLCDDCESCPADFDGDCDVDVLDLLEFLGIAG